MLSGAALVTAEAVDHSASSGAGASGAGQLAEAGALGALAIGAARALGAASATDADNAAWEDVALSVVALVDSVGGGGFEPASHDAMNSKEHATPINSWARLVIGKREPTG